MDITVIVPFFEGHGTIKELIKTIPTEFPVIVVDDVSTKRFESKDQRVKVFRLDKKGYFSGAVNFGIQQCSTDVLVLNQDVEFRGREAFDLIAHYKDEYALIGEAVSGNHPAWSMGYVHGSFMFMRRDAVQKVGLLDGKNYPLWGSTCEWQLRACRKGFKALPVRPIPGMIHKRKGNYGSSIQKLLQDDPAHKEWFIRTPPLVSVIVPSYNHGKYLPELINSLTGGNTELGHMPGQTFQSFDVIIADDCSTDDTQEIMRDLADPWKGIKYVRTRVNSGTSAACNLAIEASNSKYIARIDADDMRDTNSLEIMLDVQLANPHSFVYDDVQLFTPNGLIAKIWRMRDYNFDELIEKNFIHAGIMFPRQAWIEAGKYPEEMRHGRDDWAFNIALGLNGWCGIHLENPGYLYRRHDNNRTLRNTNPVDRAEFKRKIMSLYPEAYKEVRPMACCGGSRSSVMRSGTVWKANGGGASPGLPGAEGLILLEYQGLNYGKTTYFGPATGSAYTFSARNKRQWVDPHDIHFELANGKQIGLLDLTEGKKATFKLIPKSTKESMKRAVAISHEVASTEVPAEIVEDISDIGISEEVEESGSAMSDEIVNPDDNYFIRLTGVGLTTSVRLLDSGYASMKQLAEANTEELAAKMDWSVSKAKRVQKQASTR